MICDFRKGGPHAEDAGSAEGSGVAAARGCAVRRTGAERERTGGRTTRPRGYAVG